MSSDSAYLDEARTPLHPTHFVESGVGSFLSETRSIFFWFHAQLPKGEVKGECSQLRNVGRFQQREPRKITTGHPPWAMPCTNTPEVLVYKFNIDKLTQTNLPCMSYPG
jgi:hypothetical protein